MKSAALFPLLCLLASSTISVSALPDHSNADALARRMNSRRHHSAEVERMLENIKAREAAAATGENQNGVEKRTLAGKRIVKKRGQTCRVRGGSAASLAASASSVSAAAAASSATTSPSAVLQVDNKAAVQPSATAAPTTQAPSPAATQAPSASPSANTGSSGSGSSKLGANAGQLTPNGRKAGISAGDAMKTFESQIGWYYNWAPSDPWQSSNRVQFVPTLWGGGTTDGVDASRLADFKAMSYNPTWIVGPNEPDCAAGGAMSAGMTIDATAALWNELMVPHGNAGSLLLSPSMCKQMAEDGWLAQFQTKIQRDFDITSIHINKNNMAGVKADIDYYYNRYKKPIWVTEFACVDDSSAFIPCTDQGQINSFISDIVDVLENDDRVYAYAYSNGYGLGNVWPMWAGNGLSESGKAYQRALSKYYH